MYFLFILCFLIEKGFSTLLETNFSKALIFKLLSIKYVAYKFLKEWCPISTGIVLCSICNNVSDIQQGNFHLTILVPS